MSAEIPKEDDLVTNVTLFDGINALNQFLMLFVKRLFCSIEDFKAYVRKGFTIKIRILQNFL